LNILVKMKNDGKSNYWIKFVDKSLTHISDHADLDNAEAVKQFIANKNVSDSYKKNLCLAYDKYCEYYGIKWEMPTYYQEAKAIKIPTKEKLESLIAYAGRILGIKLRLSKETGLRPVELMNLRVKDVDLEQRLIYPKTAKHGSGRVLKISTVLQKCLTKHIIKHDLGLNDKLFRGTAERYGDHYRDLRNRLAKKLNDPTIKTIRLYDFRHYFATNLYAKTRDILLVMKQMGHKKIQTTLIYTQLLNGNDDEWTCRVANDVKQASELIEAGFEYVTGEYNDGGKLFRKRK
jgi:integrase